MDAIATTFEGFEEIAVQEIKELIGKKATSNKGIVLFSATDKELAKLCYLSQSLRSILRLYKNFSFSDLDDFKKKAVLKKSDVFVFADRSFRAECHRKGKHNFSSQDVAALFGEIILGLQKKTSVDLDDPDIIASCIINENICYLGIDFAGFDLTKREYKIYSQQTTLNAGFAYCAVRFAGYSGKEVLVDPMCGIGTIPLETGLFASHVSPRFYQKDIFIFNKILDIDLEEFDNKKDVDKKIVGYDVHLRHIESAKKMAKLAGVGKVIYFSRADLEWLDTKQDENDIDLIVTQPPVEGKAVIIKDMEKLYKEFFHQVEFVMNKKGKIILICQKTDVLKKYLKFFKIVKEHIAYQGKQKFIIVVLEME
ncbi:hypothetical protein COV16_07120 [Candidatus Woesearchaeota archaeon CG10_big_fil_rev_8_21_14_0_10_34_8]|nr:MAG: hypothetical protein COV16_07120 [Candidatus Woesearchaeota archaeon CG10_big_fil_rev_8_21_14_0_10_34_8]